MVPISEEMLEPTFPARINEMIVGESSNTVLERVIYPTVYAGKSGLSMLEAVCKAITPPINTDINETIIMESIPIFWISSNNLFLKTLIFSGLEKMILIIIKYFPICPINFTGRFYFFIYEV